MESSPFSRPNISTNNSNFIAVKLTKESVETKTEGKLNSQKVTYFLKEITTPLSAEKIDKLRENGKLLFIDTNTNQLISFGETRKFLAEAENNGANFAIRQGDQLVGINVTVARNSDERFLQIFTQFKIAMGYQVEIKPQEEASKDHYSLRGRVEQTETRSTQHAPEKGNVSNNGKVEFLGQSFQSIFKEIGDNFRSQRREDQKQEDAAARDDNLKLTEERRAERKAELGKSDTKRKEVKTDTHQEQAKVDENLKIRGSSLEAEDHPTAGSEVR